MSWFSDGGKQHMHKYFIMCSRCGGKRDIYHYRIIWSLCGGQQHMDHFYGFSLFCCWTHRSIHVHDLVFMLSQITRRIN